MGEASTLKSPDTFFFYIIPIFFQQLAYLRVYYQHTIGLITISVIIIFMIVSSWIEVGEGSNFSNNRLVIGPRFFNCYFRRKGNAPLLIIMIENCGAILGSDIVSLAVQCCRVMHMPKNLQQFLVGNNRWVVRDLNCFRGSSSPVANFF